MASIDGNQEWQQATIVDVPAAEKSNGQSGGSIHEFSEDETWPITKRDRPMSNSTAIRVMDHAHTVVAKRLSETSEGLDLLAFENSLARFLNSEIELGKRIAFGNFADIFLIRRWKESKPDKACTPEQSNAAEEILRTSRPEDLVIKVLRPSLLMNPAHYATGAADILTEGVLLATLDHPHIVRIRGRSIPSVDGFASGKRDSFFLMLERLQCNLMDLVHQWHERVSDNRIVKQGIKGRRQNRAVILLERVKLMTQLADAMTFLHSKNIIHRDLKLTNVGIDRNGNVKLIDFGLAKIIPPHDNERETFKMTGNTGSVRYMAPEIARGDPYNLKADVYSFAILLYEVLNLAKAWGGLQPQEIKTRVLTRKQRPLLSMFWPAPLRDLLKSTWSDTPGGRLSMTHVQSVLEKQVKVLQSEISSS
jgi:serine/threonine protein kinase